MKSVVLLSGGLDSTVALALANEPVEALTVDYGQRNVYQELRAAHKISAHYDVPWRVISVDPDLYDGSRSALNSDTAVPDGHADTPDDTYVPARNTLLLSLATVRAEILGAREVVIGCNHDDALGYPDCRPRYIEAFRDVLSDGTLGHVWISAPLLGRTKVDIVALAKKLKVPALITWSCYAGGDQPCGRCGACVSRADTAAAH